NAKWCATPADLPHNAPLFILANEFFDALPIRQFVKAQSGWQERQIGFTDTLTFGLAPPMPMPLLDSRFPGIPEGTLVELNPTAEAITAALAAIVETQGGAFLSIDYGAWDGTGDTLQALENHTFTDPLANPGEADLTAHVAFRWLAEATPLRPHFTDQGTFLKSLGIEQRASALSTAQPHRAEEITSQFLRLTGASEMGTLFKTLALLPQSAPLPPGFPS
ncbi:MAG: SAM-dependent methyltransferase, partial [Pseudomonadota bacterium]